MKDYASATPFIPIIIQIYGSEICFRGAFFFFFTRKGMEVIYATETIYSLSY